MLIHTREIAAAERQKHRETTTQEREALHLLRTTNIARTQIAKRTGVDYKCLTYLQHQLGIERPEQVFGLPKHDVPVRQRKPRQPKKQEQ